MSASHRLQGIALALAFCGSVWGQTAQDCKDDHLCYRRVPGAVCADGTPTGFQVMYRKGARKLMILMGGGGACWDLKTCKAGNAIYLTEHKLYEGDYFAQPSSNQQGWRDLKNPDNPISSGYHFVFVPYCTADIFTGDRVIDHGTKEEPYVMHHKGYNNTLLILDELKKRFSSVEQILLYGYSAGGLGASWHAGNLADRFPNADIHLINDGGLPFKPPFVDRLKLKAVFNAWGAEKNIPTRVRTRFQRGAPANDGYSTLMIQHIQENYPRISYGFVSAYKDYVMSYFSKMLNAGNWTTAVKEIMISLADNEFSKSQNFRVFYLNDWNHVYFGKNPATIKSKGVSLSEWVNAMLTQNPGSWVDIRPDKGRANFDLEWAPSRLVGFENQGL